ncbi:hypothetical protein [Methylocystis sp. B8]|uniref:hypothetical protein n=1 Tax=Methylocystis sp. B8 TaxID=544938 RepID=UPI0010FE6CAA|nr:hypothetical protein [Methylocystis sp. B8]TLG78521.1 hypothetical protein FEV16_00270 [Methylocystis sp. B8]
MSDQLDDIIDGAFPSFKEALTAAFEAGRAAGRQEASVELKAKLADALGIQQAPDRSFAKKLVGQLVETTRAAQGTVKPKILEAIRSRGGATLGDIQEATGVKYNTVRGTLWQLSQDEVIERRGEKWFMRPQKNEPAGTPSESAPTGSKPEPSFHEALFGSGAKGREAGPGGET